MSHLNIVASFLPEDAPDFVCPVCRMADTACTCPVELFTQHCTECDADVDVQDVHTSPGFTPGGEVVVFDLQCGHQAIDDSSDQGQGIK